MEPRDQMLPPRRDYPDALIARVADHLGAAIVNANLSDFRAWIALGQLDATVQDARD